MSNRKLGLYVICYRSKKGRVLVPSLPDFLHLLTNVPSIENHQPPATPLHQGPRPQNFEPLSSYPYESLLSGTVSVPAVFKPHTAVILEKASTASEA